MTEVLGFFSVLAASAGKELSVVVKYMKSVVMAVPNVPVKNAVYVLNEAITV